MPQQSLRLLESSLPWKTHAKSYEPKGGARFQPKPATLLPRERFATTSALQNKLVYRSVPASRMIDRYAPTQKLPIENKAAHIALPSSGHSTQEDKRHPICGSRETDTILGGETKERGHPPSGKSKVWERESARRESEGG